MKKNLIKKVFAVSLSIAMACSFLPAANPVTASAAAPYVSLKTTFKTLKVGQKYKMTLKNNSINWKIKKVETTDKTIAMVYGKTTSQVMLKGKSEGRATVRVHVKTSKRKTKNTKTLRCRVKVVTATPTVDPTTPTQTEATVTNQQELDTALNTSSITKITIKPASAENFEIKSGTYSNVDLIVDAPQSDIVNNAKFKSITINDIKTDTWTERGTGNVFSIRAKKARIVVDKGATVESISIGTADAKIDLQVDGGIVKAVDVTAKVELNIKGTAAEGAALIPVSFSAAAADSKFNTELPVAVALHATIEITFEKGAVKSTVKLEVAGISVKIQNNTTEPIVVTKNDGKTTQSIAAGKSGTVDAIATTTPVNPGTSTSSPGTSVNKSPATASVVTGQSVSVTVSGGALVESTSTSSGALKISNSEYAYLSIGISGVTVTGSSLNANNMPTVHYEIIASQTDWTKTVTSGDMTWNGTDYEAKADHLSLVGATVGEDKDIKLTISFTVKETASTAASAPATGTFTFTIPVERAGWVTINNAISGSLK